MKIAIMNPRLPALIALAIVAALAALMVTPGKMVDAAQTVDARVDDQILEIRGTRNDDHLTLRLRAGDANVLEIDVGDDGTADFSFELASFTEIKVIAKSGDDVIRVDEANGQIVAPTSILGENGNDTILGGSAIETIDGGRGDDFIDGNRAADIAFMGRGDDTFRWDPGDGSDVVEGEKGTDTLLFNGANGGETVDLSANGERFTFFRQPGNITMDTNEVEISVFNALGGPDAVTVNDLTGTDVTLVDLDLDAGLGSGAGDGQPDQVIVNGTAADDEDEGDEDDQDDEDEGGDDASDDIVVTGAAGSVNVTGLSATVAIAAAEAGNDRLDINTAGATVDTSGLASGVIQLFVDGLPV